MLRYAKGPVSYLYRDKPNKTGVVGRRKVKQVLWGDWIRVEGPDQRAGWQKVSYGKQPYLMRDDDLQEHRVLEIIFLDVGQGDGCILTEPGAHDDPKILVVDAGVGKNMNSFLNWRFRDFPETGNIHAAIITHPDKDHYLGFSPIFQNKKFKIDHVYHNGLVERTGDDLLGPESDGYLTDIVADHNRVKTLLSNKKTRGGKLYPNLLKRAIDAAHIGPITAVTTAHGSEEDGKAWLPGFRPSDTGPVSIEILGPVIEPDTAGNPRLRAFGSSPAATSMNDGKTKNGHSILLRLEFNGMRVLFGGDLNVSSETFLMQWYGNKRKAPAPLSGESTLNKKIANKTVIEAARKRLAVDLMKTCHHGSSDVTREFLQATNATAFVVSSGDNESHVHPRPDLLGLLGKCGRGDRPLLLSTELLRSTRERESSTLGKKLDKVSKAIEQEVSKGTSADKTVLKALRSERKDLRQTLLKRNVGVFGAVNLRTDGTDAVIAFRKESSSDKNRWFYYELTKGSDGTFVTDLKGH